MLSATWPTSSKQLKVRIYLIDVGKFLNSKLIYSFYTFAVIVACTSRKLREHQQKPDENILEVWNQQKC